MAMALPRNEQHGYCGLAAAASSSAAMPVNTTPFRTTGEDVSIDIGWVSSCVFHLSEPVEVLMASRYAPDAVPCVPM